MPGYLPDIGKIVHKKECIFLSTIDFDFFEIHSNSSPAIVRREQNLQNNRF